MNTVQDDRLIFFNESRFWTPCSVHGYIWSLIVSPSRFNSGILGMGDQARNERGLGWGGLHLRRTGDLDDIDHESLA